MMQTVINRIIMELRYPPGTLLRLRGDYPQDDMHEVAGYSYYGREGYLLFQDGRKLSMERLDLIVEEERKKDD